MTIKGLHRNHQTPRSLARAGIIRLGYKAKKCQNKKCGQIIEASVSPCPNCGKVEFSKEFPRESPHFILTDAPELSKILGPEPTELRVFFPFNDINQVFPNFMQAWQASSLICRGDGEMILYAIEPQTGKVVIRDGHALMDYTEGKRSYEQGQLMPCPGLDRNLYPRCKHCKPNAILIIMLRDIPRLAYYQISTTSIHNIANLPEQLEYVRDIVQRLTGKAQITGVPFILRRVKRTISTPKTNDSGEQTGRRRAEKYFLELEIEPEWVLRMMTAQRRLADPMQRFEALPPGEPIEEQETPRPERYAEPPVWEPRDYEDEPEVEIIEAVVEYQPESPALVPANGDKDKEPERNHTDDIYDEVNRLTNGYYTKKEHLYAVIKPWPLPGDEEGKQRVIKAAIRHVSNKVDEKAAEQEEPKKTTMERWQEQASDNELPF